jgi:hypothetical protein
LLNDHQKRQKEKAQKVVEERRSAKKLTKYRKCSVAASLSRQLCADEEDLSVVSEATPRKIKEKITPMRPKKTLAKIKVETPGLTDLYGKVATDSIIETKTKVSKTTNKNFADSNQSLDKSDKSLESISSVEKPLHRRRTSKSPIRPSRRSSQERPQEHPRRRSREGLDDGSTHHRTRRADPLARSSHVSVKDKSTDRSGSVGPVGRRLTNQSNNCRRGRSTSVSAIEHPERGGHQNQTRSKHRGQRTSVSEKRAQHANQQADLAKQRGRSTSVSQRRAQHVNHQVAKRAASQSVTRGGSRRDHQDVGKSSERGTVVSHEDLDVIGRRSAYKNISKSGYRHSYQDLTSDDLKKDKNLLPKSSVRERRSPRSDRWSVDGSKGKVEQLSKSCHGRRPSELTRGPSVPRRMNSVGDKALQDDNVEIQIPYTGKPMSPKEYQEMLLRLQIDSAKAKSKGSAEKEDTEPEIIELGRRRRTSDGLDLNCSRSSGRQRRRSSMGAL